MELKWLEDFVALAESSSFSRAAEARNVTQPAFSRRIKQLEAWLGTPLINRATIPAELTPAGRHFLPVAQDAIRTFGAVREALRPISEAGLIRFAALHTLTITFFPEWLGELEKELQDLRSSLSPDRGGVEANLSALTEGEADFFLTYAHAQVPFHLDREKFGFLDVGRDRLIPVAAPELRLRGFVQPGAGMLDRALAQKKLLPYLSYGQSSFFGVALQKLFAARPPLRLRITHENTISAGLKTMAMAGSGLCWLPESLVREELAEGRLVEASEAPEWRLDLKIRLYRHKAPRSPAAERFWTAAERLAASAQEGGFARAQSAREG